MLQNYNKYRVLQVFFDEPTTEHQLREIARKAKLAPPSTKRYLKELEDEGFILRRKHKLSGFPVYVRNPESERYKLLRGQNVVLRLEESGLLDKLYLELGARCIILFGSAQRGEDIEESDIDLFVLGTDEIPDTRAYEPQLRRKIHTYPSKNFEKHAAELKNNLCNAIVLRGYLDVFAHEPYRPRTAEPQASGESRRVRARNARIHRKH